MKIISESTRWPNVQELRSLWIYWVVCIHLVLVTRYTGCWDTTPSLTNWYGCFPGKLDSSSTTIRGVWGLVNCSRGLLTSMATTWPICIHHPWCPVHPTHSDSMICCRIRRARELRRFSLSLLHSLVQGEVSPIKWPSGPTQRPIFCSYSCWSGACTNAAWHPSCKKLCVA